MEDNELNQQVAIELLTCDGIQIDVVDNGKVAVDMVAKHAYDVVLMDMQMPVMDGFEATKRIRENPEFSSLPIIAMTANAMSEDRERCISAGMNDFVTKPVDPEQLFSALHRWTKSVQEHALFHMEDETPAAVNPQQAVLLNIDIPGLDTQLGLKRILGKQDVYIKILRKFTAAQRNAISEIEKTLDAGDRETAVRIAHTLKGLAGNIGAEELQVKAAALEAILKENAPRKALQKTMDETRNILSFLVNELDMALPPETREAARAGPESSVNELQMILKDLKPHIQSRKPKKCAEVLKKYRKLVWPENLQEDAAALDRMVSKYLYREALETLDSLMLALGGKV